MARTFDWLALTLLVVGGLNWGLVAIAEFDLVAWISGLTFGETNAFSRAIYGLVGLSAVYTAVRVPAWADRMSPAAARAHSA